jgi:hypothetical protein
LAKIKNQNSKVINNFIPNHPRLCFFSVKQIGSGKIIEEIAYSKNNLWLYQNKQVKKLAFLVWGLLVLQYIEA